MIGVVGGHQLSTLNDQLAPALRRAARARSLLTSFICSVRFHVSLRNGFFTDRFEPAAAPPPLLAAPPPALDSKRCGASDVCASTHSSKVIGVTPPRP